MNTADKTAGIFGPSAEQAAQHEAALNKFYGGKMLSSLGAGAGIGLGATAIYHLLRNLKPSGKKEKKYTGYGSGSPLIAKEANINGGLTNAAPQNGFNPPMMKNSLDLGRVQETLGGMLPKTLIPFSTPSLAGSPAPSSDPHAWRKAWGTAANIGAGALGLYGGKKLVDSLVKAKKKRDIASEMEKARQDYYSALRGDKSAAMLPYTLAGAGIGSGLGAGIGAYRAPEGKKMRGALQGGVVGGGVGAGAGALLSKLLASGGAATKLLPPGAGAGVPAPVPPKVPPAPAGAAAAAGGSAGGLGGMGGAAAPKPAPVTPPLKQMEAAVALPIPGSEGVAQTVTRTAPPPLKMRAKGAAHEIAQQDYYAALSADSDALDFAFETVKHANILTSLGSAAVNTPQALRTAYLMAMLTAGGVGAKYMYDKTKETTKGENLAKAQASRARTKGLPPVWIDPESLASIKTLAGSNE